MVQLVRLGDLPRRALITSNEGMNGWVSVKTKEEGIQLLAPRTPEITAVLQSFDVGILWPLHGGMNHSPSRLSKISLKS